MTAPTLADAIIDHTIPMHWLLEIRVGTTVVGRFADAELSAGGRHWSGTLAMRTPPSLRIDVYTGRADVCRCTVAIAARPGDISCTDASVAEDVRACDLERLHSTTFGRMSATLYRWVEGGTLTRDDIIIDGGLAAANIAEDGTLVCDVVDSTRRMDRKFPRYVLDKVRFPSMHDDDVREGPNILYGTFAAIPCPVSNTGATKYGHGAAGNLGTLTSAQLDGAAAAGATMATAQTDGKGDTYSRIAIGEDPADKTLTIAGTGYKDGPHGFWTGNANATITNPADQLYHFAREWCDIPAAKLDHAGFVRLRDSLATWATALGVLGTERTSWTQVAADMAALYRGAVYEERGLVTTRELSFGRTAALRLSDSTPEREGNLKEFTVRPPGEDEIPSQIRLSYAWGWKTGKDKQQRADYRKLLVRDGDDYSEFSAARQQGGEPLEITTRNLGDHAGTAARVIYRLCELHRWGRRTATALVDRSAHNTRILDNVLVTAWASPSLDGQGADGEKWAVIGITYGLDSSELELLEAFPALQGAAIPGRGV